LSCSSLTDTTVLFGCRVPTTSRMTWLPDRQLKGTTFDTIKIDNDFLPSSVVSSFSSSTFLYWMSPLARQFCSLILRRFHHGRSRWNYVSTRTCGTGARTWYQLPVSWGQEENFCTFLTMGAFSGLGSISVFSTRVSRISTILFGAYRSFNPRFNCYVAFCSWLWSCHAFLPAKKVSSWHLSCHMTTIKTVVFLTWTLFHDQGID